MASGGRAGRCAWCSHTPWYYGAIGGVQGGTTVLAGVVREGARSDVHCTDGGENLAI